MKGLLLLPWLAAVASAHESDMPDDAQDDAAPPVPAVVQAPTPPDLIRDAVVLGAPAVRACYEARLAEVPGLKGRVVLEVRVVEGVVKDPVITEDDIGDAALNTCMLDAARAWTFPPSVTDAIVVPFSLSAS